MDPNALAEVSKSHDVTSPMGPGDKTDETTAEADNLVNFSKPLEFGTCFVPLNYYRARSAYAWNSGKVRKWNLK